MNLVHKLYRLQNFGDQPLEYFKDMVTKEELADAAKKQSSSKRTWYTLTQPSLINILYQVQNFHSYLLRTLISFKYSEFLNWYTCLSF